MKKLLSLVLALAVCAGGGILTGCGKEEDKLVVATNAAFAPFEFKQGESFVGIDMEIAQGFADYLGQKLEIRDMNFDAVVTSVGKNGVDIAMAGLTVSEKRKESVDFTDTYYNASQMIIVKADDTKFDACTTAEEAEALLNVSGVKIGVQSGTTGQYLVEGDEEFEFPGYLNTQCLKYDNAGLAVQAMKNGNVDYVIVDEAPAKNLVAKVAGVKVINIKLTDEQYAFGVDKAQPELLTKFNTYLAQIKENGKFDEIVNKYFSEGEAA